MKNLKDFMIALHDTLKLAAIFVLVIASIFTIVYETSFTNVQRDDKTAEYNF